MKAFFNSLFTVIGLTTLFSCSSNSNKDKKDDILSGTITVAVDASVLPIIQEQEEVFESSYYNAAIALEPMSEVQTINSLIKGDVAVAVLTRQLTDVESTTFKQRSITPKIYSIAYDGIVLVGNVSSLDTSFTKEKIVELMKGNKVDGISLVFEDLNSSIFRYFKDLSKMEKVANTYVEVRDSARGVLSEIVSSNNKIGLISFNQYLSLQSSFKEKDKIRILSVLNDSLEVKKYVKPSQSSLATGEYPFKRELFVLNYQPNLGLGMGFSAFMTGDRGQRIVLKSGLLPAKMPGREIIIRDRVE